MPIDASPASSSRKRTWSGSKALAVERVQPGAAGPAIASRRWARRRSTGDYSWMFTGYQVSSSGGSTFEGNIVIFENRPFGIDAVPNPPGPGIATGTYQVDGETVVEAIFGPQRQYRVRGRARLRRRRRPDRSLALVFERARPGGQARRLDRRRDVRAQRLGRVSAAILRQADSERPPAGGVPNPFNNGEWDNLPAQRCYWYQVQKVTPAIDDPYTAGQNHSVAFDGGVCRSLAVGPHGLERGGNAGGV